MSIHSHKSPGGREVIEDGAQLAGLLDAVLGITTMALAVFMTFAALTGKATVITTLLVWSIPVFNVAWNALTKHRSRYFTEPVRTLVSIPIVTIVYMTHGGYCERLWVLAEVMVVGQAVNWGWLTGRALLGLLATVIYAAAILVGGVVSFGAPYWPSVTDAVGILVTGFIVSLVSRQLGRSLEDARRSRDEAVSSKRRLESALTDLTSARAKLDAVLDCAPASILAVDRDGRIAFTNRVAPPLDKEKVIGTQVLDHVLPEGRELFTSRMTAVLATGEPQTIELHGRSPDGAETWRASHLGAMRNGDEVIGVVVISQDVTELKRTQAEIVVAQRLASVGTLAAGIAHEINTPIQFVSDSTNFLRDATRELFDVVEKLQVVRHLVESSPPITPALNEALSAAADAQDTADLSYLIEHMPKAFERCVDGLDRVAAIVLSMKEFAHPSQKDMASVDLNRAILSTLTIASNEYKYVADLETSFGDLPPVTCYVNDVNQVVLNLIVNAAHAVSDVVKGTSSRGTIGVDTRLDGPDVIISIRDTGTGIPEAVRGRIFDPFFTTKEVGKGTGQGLSMAWKVIKEKHHGDVTFDTQVGVGTTFHVRLPVAGVAAQ